MSTHSTYCPQSHTLIQLKLERAACQQRSQAGLVQQAFTHLVALLLPRHHGIQLLIAQGLVALPHLSLQVRRGT
eukprot:1155956-Pelagomonas_calceolata.AAC.11